ncbi:hypothetical protein HO133_004105 [Letharia lupina]|uniref:Peptidyl-prolyl cis-trans isomerase-like 1 n=2 Tax=Letharia TaxID=112415 RepID=A0A8H6F968_9LECA|nr:uncharacterized protein HO133_004105 [Letharia lupina]KAF6219636.1 hypothetical protein HO133_004105 [Letharia lupina]
MLPKPFLFPALLIHSSYSLLKAAAISFPSQPGVSALSSPESSNETSKIPNQLPYTGTNPYCSASIIWTGFNTLDSHFQRDCRAATDKFENFVASCSNPNTRYEFLDPRTQPMQRLPKMETPRRYVSRIGRCTVAIVNLVDFPAEYLPTQRSGPFRKTDVDSYEGLGMAVTEMYTSCLPHSLGWAAVGEASSLGVFIFATGSLVDQKIEKGFPPEGAIRGAMATNVVLDTTMGSITLELYNNHAPKTCNNFSTLAQRGYYNNVIFHRIIPNFMLQTGDPTGTGRGGASIYGEKFEDEIDPGLKHTGAGILSMANSGKNTNGSQFFITLAPTPWLDGKHTIFGRVKSGLRVVQRMGLVKTGPEDRPVDQVKIIRARVVEEGEEGI